MIDAVARDAETRMNKCIDALRNELSKVRTGRAHPSLLESIRVQYYGNETPLNQVASVAIESSRALTVTPWDKGMIPVIEKAISSSDLGLNPVTAGQIIRVPLPPLTEQRRKELVKVVRDAGEQAKVSVRNVRRDANQSVKDLLKEKKVSEDDVRRSETQVQKLTDEYIAEVDKTLASKESELMEI
jgi:ribosome recycling factor